MSLSMTTDDLRLKIERLRDENAALRSQLVTLGGIRGGNQGEVRYVPVEYSPFRLQATGEWMGQVREWAASHPQRDHVVDDSRESIYGD